MKNISFSYSEVVATHTLAIFFFISLVIQCY